MGRQIDRMDGWDDGRMGDRKDVLSATIGSIK